MTRSWVARHRLVPAVAVTVALLASLAVDTLSAAPADAAAATWYEAHFAEGVPAELDGSWGWEATSAGHVGPSLRTWMLDGEHWGASGHIEMSEVGASGTDELYWRYWLWLDPNFYVEPPSRGKLPGPAGLYSYNCLGGRTSTVSEPCWSARTMFSRTYPFFGEPLYPDGPDDITQLGSYVYHLDGPSNRGEIVMWDDDVAQLEHGRWYCVEGQVAMNTPGAYDGVLRAWVDGQSALDLDSIRFRRSSETNIHVKSFWMDVYHGGSIPSARDNEIRLDSLALGPSRIGCDDSSSWQGTFWDDDSSPHQSDIEWLAAQGVTRGCNPPANDRFCPTASVNRDQMAAFLQRAKGYTDPGGDRFTDDDNNMFESAIQALAGAGITVGCNPPTNDRFCPTSPVTRGQMAIFITRAYGLPPAPGADTFVDDDDSIFRNAIESLAAAGITRGCNPPTNDRFCPDDPVTRAQMATFLHRASTL